jgi:MFS family permease
MSGSDDQNNYMMDSESTKLLRHESKSQTDGIDANVLSSLVDDNAEKKEISILRLFLINMFAFNYGLFYASVGVLLLPEEALRMFEDDHAVFLAVMLMLAGISQLISPLAGYCSDRDTHRMGRRLPYILGGNAVLLCMIGCLYLARSYMYGWAYLALLLIAIVALNVAYTGFTGLISDVIPASQMGSVLR